MATTDRTETMSYPAGEVPIDLSVNTMNEWANKIYRWADQKGFPHPSGHDDTVMLLSRLMLVVSEIGEAAEAIRKKELDIDNFNEEIADTIIRLLHLCGALGIDIDAEVAAKMETNAGRPIRHGKRT